MNFLSKTSTVAVLGIITLVVLGFLTYKVVAKPKKEEVALAPAEVAE